MSSSSRRRVKVVCTLGPSSSSPERIRELLESGLDVARLNFSHGDHAFHRKLIETVRKEGAPVPRPIAIMQDLQGPKIRAGKLAPGGLQLKAGDVLLLYPEGTTPKTSTTGKILVPISAEIAEPVARSVRAGARILFDDGKIATRASQVSAPEIVTEVEVGGKLTDHKGMNLPGTPLTIPCLTDKDYEDLKFGLSQGVDSIALSFVRSSQDIEILREKIRKHSNTMPLIVAKIEREEAIEEMDGIIEQTDGLLIARGDMAVEIGAERVPTIQKRLIKACNELGVPVITATQMLESMISSPTPTRAEASDVANAVYDGTDAVMLSGETAGGQYPSESVRTMVRIILEAERSMAFLTSRQGQASLQSPLPGSVVDSVEWAAAEVAQQVGATAIACLTHSGMAARTLAKYRPSTPIVAIMDQVEALRRMAFVWGVHGTLLPGIVSTDDLFQVVEETLLREGYAEVEDLIVVTAGVPTLRRGTTNMLKVHRIGTPLEKDF